MINKPLVILLSAVLAPLCSAQTVSALHTPGKIPPAVSIKDFGSTTAAIAAGAEIGQIKTSVHPAQVSASSLIDIKPSPRVGPGPHHLNPVPEPATLAALSFGLLPLLKRRKKA